MFFLIEIFLFVVKMSFIFASNNSQCADCWQKLSFIYFNSLWGVLTNIRMISCSTCTDCVLAACWEVCECALPNMPTGPAHSPRWHSSLSDSLPPRWPDQTALVRTVLTLPTGYNYSVFYCSPSSRSLCFSLSPGSWHWGPGGQPRGRCFVFTVCWMALTELWLRQVGGLLMCKGV